MALSQHVLGAILQEIAATSQDAVTTEIRNAYVTATQQAAQAALGAAVAVDISNWAAVKALVNTPGAVAAAALQPIRQQIQAKIDAEDLEDLDLLLFMLVAASKSHFGS